MPQPQTVKPVKPHVFRGDVRRLPRGNVVQPEERPEPQSPHESPPAAVQPDPAVQQVGTAAPAPAPSTSWAGLDFANWGAGWPPDPNGDVGPAYYIQVVNTSIGIFDKATGNRVAAFTFDSLFSAAASGTPCDNSNQGDPVVLYDPIGDRWLISDFAWSNYASGAMYECMAVSRTNNPVAGGWYFYPWQVETGGTIPDYPKLGVWPDGIYMSANLFSTTGSGSFKNVQVWAFNRREMEAGTTAHSVTFNLPRTAGGITVFSLLPSNARVVTGLPPAAAQNYFASIWGAYAIRVWKFHVDWTTPSSSTFSGPTDVPISTFNVGPSSAPELGGNKIDTLSYRLMMQNQYTNLNGAESLWLTHTVGSGGSPNVARVRWYQLPVTGGTIAGSPAQQSTFAPDSKNRFMPSLAVDKNGDIAIGYSVSDGSMYPSIRYAGRLSTDPANTLGQSETSLIEGTGFQCCTFSNGSTNTRWGDYSAMTIDPDGCTFWYTNEYYDAKPTTLAQDNWKTRIGSFRLPGCSPQAPTSPTVSSFTPTSGKIGTSVVISGTLFTGATTVTFNGVSAAFTVDSDTQITATVPDGATNGPISVTTPGGTGTSTSSFAVLQTLSLSATSGSPGKSVTVSGTGFHPGTTVTLKWNCGSSGCASTTVLGTPSVGGNGSFSTPVTIPTPVPAGTYPIGGQDTLGGFAKANFVVKPALTRSPTSGKPGSSFTVSGTGYHTASTVTIKWKCGSASCTSTTVLATPTTDANGSFSVSVSAPSDATAGTWSVGGKDASGSFATTTYKIVPLLAIAPTSGAAGSGATVTGNAYTPGETVTLLWNCATSTCASTTVLATPVADSTGHFSAAVTMPSTGVTVGTTYKIRGKGGTSAGIAYTSFQVTS